MKEMNTVLKELDDVLLVIPNALTDGTVIELPHFQFVKSKVSSLNNPLWAQGLHNVSAKLFDLDISSINADASDVYHKLRNLDFNSLNVLSKYYLNLNLEAYNYEETELGHFLNNNNEIINIETVCKLLSISISDNLDAVTNFILAQLISVQKEEWMALYEIEEDDYNTEYLLSELSNLI